MSQRSIPPLPSQTLEVAKELRSTMTDAERELWYHLRAGRLNGLKFRRQHPVPPDVVDFICVDAKLIVELDGSQHNAPADAVRERFLTKRGLRVVQFWNNDVLSKTAVVLDAILSAVGDRTLSPTPLPPGEGLYERA